MYKIRIQRDLFETCNKWSSDKGFLLTTKVCPQGVFCPCPGASNMYKIIKNVYKVRFRWDHFETCNIWAKRKGHSVVIKILFQGVVCPCPGAKYMYKSIQKYIRTRCQVSVYNTTGLLICSSVLFFFFFISPSVNPLFKDIKFLRDSSMEKEMNPEQGIFPTCCWFYTDNSMLVIQLLCN